MNDIVQRIAKLIDVKSIMTLALTTGFIILTIRGDISGEQFMSSYGLVLGAFFSYQAVKSKNSSDEDLE
jgi:hypothetical protein